MPPLHLHRAEARILVCPASDPVLRAGIETYVPSCYRRFHPYLDGWEFNPSFERLILRIVGVTHGPDALCHSCWTGTPCEEWINAVHARFTIGRNVHTQAWDLAYEASLRNTETYNYDPKPPPHTASPTKKSKDRTIPTNVRDAIRLLGLTWPCNQDKLATAFRDHAIRAHPDHGGTDDAMIRILAARRTITQAIQTEGTDP